MKQVVIENPILNSPFEEPARHFRFTDEGISNEVVTGRRTSSYFVPIAKPKKKGSKQLQLETEWTQDRIEENKLVNDIRYRIALWRKGGYVEPARARRTRPPRPPRRVHCGCQPSTTTAVSGAGRSSRSPTRGTRRMQSEPAFRQGPHHE